MGNLRGLPEGFEYCGCDKCCPEREQGKKLPPAPGKKEHCFDGRPNCYCELFYHHADGSHKHRRYLALPGSGGTVEPQDEFVYDYYCVQPAFDISVNNREKYKSVCDEPVTQKDQSDPMSDKLVFTCPGGCTGGKCFLFYVSGGEDGYDDRWKPVGKGEAFGKKFSVNSSGRLTIAEKDLDELKTKYRFKCFCL